MNLKKILLGLTCLLLVSGCGIPTTKDGEEAVVTFKNDDKKHNITADDLYELLKEKYGFNELITLIDTYVLESEFEDYKTTAKDYAKNYVNGQKANYNSDEEFLSAITQTYGYNTIDEYVDYIYLSYMQSHAIEEYAKSLVTDKQIEKYYKEDAKEQVETYHILITPNVTSEMNDNEISKAEKKAMDKAEKLLKEINASNDKLKTFKKLAKKNTEDEATKEKSGNLGYINEFTLGTEYDELVKAVYEIKDGEVYGKVVTTELGYHLVLRNASKEKDSLENMKEDILNKLSQNVMAADPNFAVTSIKYYRDKYNMKITDKDLNKSYRTYMNDLTAQTSANVNQ